MALLKSPRLVGLFSLLLLSLHAEIQSGMSGSYVEPLESP